MKAFAVVIVALAAFTVVRAENPVTVSGVTYSYGVCQPTGSYTMNECCPLGYEVITTETECELAFNNMSPLETGSFWGGLANRNQRPYGCYQWLGSMVVHFNSVVPGATLFGDDLVICKSSTVETCAAPTIHRGTSFPQDALQVTGPAAAVELGGDFEIEGEFKVNTPADGKYKPILSRTIGSTYTNNNAQIDIQVQANGNFNVFMSGSSIYEVNLNGGIMPANTWTHFRLSMVNNVASLYINGLRKGTDPFSGTRFLNGNGNPLEIGHYANAQQQYFDGEIRNVRVSTQCAMTGPPPTQDPAVAAFCDNIQSQCSVMDAECLNIRNGHGPLLGAGSMTHQAGSTGSGEPTGGVTLSGNSVVITATGNINCGAGCPNTPDGSGNAGNGNFLLPGASQHSLLARIGAGPWQFIGAGPTTLTGTGALTFAFNDQNGGYGDNSGSWFITVRTDITNVADDCDASVVACGDVEADCRDKAASCPLV